MDTTPEVEAIQFAFFRSAPAWKKLEIASQLNSMARTLALSGLRQRHPHATDDALQRYLADMLLGPDLAERVYGPIPQVDKDTAFIAELPRQDATDDKLSGDETPPY